MTSLELTEIVEERMADPAVLGRIACNLRSSDLVEQRHHDDRNLRLEWQDSGDFWRCIVFSNDSANKRIAQVDIHENATVRFEAYEPCRITVSPEDGILCLTRYRPV